MLHVHFVLSRVISISCVLLASIPMLLLSKPEMSSGGKAELRNARKVTGVTCEQGSKRLHLRPLRVIPQLSEADDFFLRLGILEAHFLKMTTESTILRKQKLLWKAETDGSSSLKQEWSYILKACGKLNLK